jgi:hypothetical protein
MVIYYLRLKKQDNINTMYLNITLLFLIVNMCVALSIYNYVIIIAAVEKQTN